MSPQDWFPIIITIATAVTTVATTTTVVTVTAVASATVVATATVVDTVAIAAVVATTKVLRSRVGSSSSLCLCLHSAIEPVPVPSLCDGP